MINQKSNLDVYLQSQSKFNRFIVAVSRFTRYKFIHQIIIKMFEGSVYFVLEFTYCTGV